MFEERLEATIRSIRVDVVIPVFRDNPALECLLSSLPGNWPREHTCVVFGEPDSLGEAIAEHHGLPWLRADRAGRACQMNTGATFGTGEAILFLHADSELPDNTIQAVAAAVGAGASGGAFTRRFDSPSLFLAMTCRLADWRGQGMGIFLGDQGLFVRRDVFESLGGFDESTRYEDLDFSLRLRQVGRTVLLRPILRTSIRRFETKGSVRQSFEDLRQVVLSMMERSGSSHSPF